MGKPNKESSIPLYQWLMEAIQNQMLNGELKENDRIPTGIELSKEYDVSRTTVRKAVELLVEEKILVKRQGIGTSMSQKRLCRNTSGLTGFTQSCLVEEDTVEAQLVSVELAEAIMVDVEELKIWEHEEIIKTVRVWTCNGIPVMPKEDHFPARLAYFLGYDPTGSIYQILAENGAIMDNGIKWIGICQANEIEHKHLGVDLDKPLLYIKDVSYDQERNPVHNCKSAINPDRYKTTVMVNA